MIVNVEQSSLGGVVVNVGRLVGIEDLNTVDSCKYLGHIISATNDDNLDIVRQMGLLYARTIC